ncbi:MAG: hypothetical protein J2P18_18550 [Nocardia sp.]|nr:hypothetical protein [Nocardia sp.]
MKTTFRAVATCVLAATAIATATGTAFAQPNPVPAAPHSNSTTTQLAPNVGYRDDPVTGTAQLRTPIGSIAIGPGALDVRDGAGRTVAGAPINTRATDRSPDRTPPQAQPAATQPNNPMSDIHESVEAAAPHMGMAMAVGAAAGSLIGGVIGCPFGMATGGTLVSVASLGTMTVPAMAAACIIGTLAVGGAAATVGGPAVAIPVGIIAGTQKYNELQAQHAKDAQGATAPAPPAS